MSELTREEKSLLQRIRRGEEEKPIWTERERARAYEELRGKRAVSTPQEEAELYGYELPKRPLPRMIPIAEEAPITQLTPEEISRLEIGRKRELGKKAMIAPCIPEITEPKPNYICGECETTERENSNEIPRRVSKCRNYSAEETRCVRDVIAKREATIIEEKTEIALGCAESGLPASVAAHLIGEPYMQTLEAMMNLRDIKPAKTTVETSETTAETMSSDKNPRFWFGDPVFYLDPELKRKIRKEAEV